MLVYILMSLVVGAHWVMYAPLAPDVFPKMTSL